MRRVGDHYYNLDSKLDTPERIDDLVAFLKDQINSKDKELMVVVSRERSQLGEWYHERQVTRRTDSASGSTSNSDTTH